jgi:hypothetical protein
MASNPAVTASDMVNYVQTNFWDTYRLEEAGADARLSEVMEVGLPSTRRIEKYGYWESAPYLRRVDRGRTTPSKNIRSRTFQAENFEWKVRTEWHRTDRRDDQTKSIVDAAREVGEHAGAHKERLFFQTIQGATDTDLLESIPNAPDGAALFNATDGDGANRFGVSGGNTFAGVAGPTAQGVRADYFKAMGRFRRFQNTEGQPLWSEGVMDKGTVVIFNPLYLQVFAEAFEQRVNMDSANTSTSNAGVSNVILDSKVAGGGGVRLWATQRMTGTTWAIFLRGAKKKAAFEQVREPVYEVMATEDNSDTARDTGVEYVQWSMSGTVRTGPAYGAISIT